MTVFEEYAKYYDLLYKDKNYSKEIEYIDSLIRDYTDQHDIIEFGCGSGIHAIELAKLGYSVYGIDVSESMVQQANDRLSRLNDSLSNLISFHSGDLANFTSTKKYNIAISLFHVISYMETDYDVNNAFSTVNQSLKKGGIFIFDFWHGPGVLNDPPIEVHRIVEKDGLIIRRDTKPLLKKEEKIVNVNFDLSISLNEEKIDEVQECHVMRYFSEKELTEFLKANNFSVLYSKEWLRNKELSKDSWYGCMIAQKEK